LGKEYVYCDLIILQANRNTQYAYLSC
jgi:hypothetical protein